MSDSIDTIRRRVLGVQFSDGIFELYVGFVLSFIGLLEMNQHFGNGEGMTGTYVPVVVLFPMFLFFIAKRNITRKRIGLATMQGARYKPSRIHVLFVVILGLFLFAGVYLMQRTGAGSSEPAPGVKPYLGLYFGIFSAVILSILGVLTESIRLHLTAISFFVVFLLLFVLQLYIGFGFIINGLLLLAVGTVLLRRFLLENPVLPSDDYERPATDE